jgi:phage terminase large subunit
MQLLPRQSDAVFYLKDQETKEILYGGAAGGGKSALGCLWLIEMCQTHKGSRWLMGRSKLKALKETTLNTFFELASELKITNQFTYNAQANIIYWNNGSQILLKDLFLYPSDQNFDSLGSLEICGAFIDECNQVVFKAWQIVTSRCRYKLKEFGIIPKVLGSCNPAKNWTYKEFYEPNKTKTLKPYRKFIQALPTDNPHLPKSYLESLLSLDSNSKERLYFGNWEYDDDPNALCDYENILSIFKNDHIPGGTKFLTADIARLGSDRAIIGVWSGWRLTDSHIFDVSRLTEIQSCIEAMRVKHGIPKNNCIADEDGVGGGVVDNCGIKGFVNGSKALIDDNYYNLQSQCCYKLAEKIQENGIHIECELSGKQQDEITEEIEQLKSYELDKDGKLRILPKAKIKENIGRSPDWRDMLMMRAYFDLSPKKKIRSRTFG